MDKVDVRGDGRVILYKRDGLKNPVYQARLRVPNAAGYKIVTTKTANLREADGRNVSSVALVTMALEQHAFRWNHLSAFLSLESIIHRARCVRVNAACSRTLTAWAPWGTSTPYTVCGS
jgi:hypothetical protein